MVCPRIHGLAGPRRSYCAVAVPGAGADAAGGGWRGAGRRAVGVSTTGAQAVRAGAMVEKEETGGGISEEEAAQYDRQIRLWGLEAQKRSGPVRLVGLRV